jgi:hypothetical protein
VAVGRACPTGWWAAGPGPTWAGPVAPGSAPEPMRPGPPVSPSHVGLAALEAPGPVAQEGTVGLSPAQPGPGPMPMGPRLPEPPGPRRAPAGPEQPPVPGRGVGQDGELARVPARAGVGPEQPEPLPGRSAPERDRSMPVVRMRVDW